MGSGLILGKPIRTVSGPLARDTHGVVRVRYRTAADAKPLLWVGSRMGCAPYADVINLELAAFIRECTAVGCTERKVQTRRVPEWEARTAGSPSAGQGGQQRPAGLLRRGVYGHQRLPTLLRIKLSRAMRTTAQKPKE